MKTITRILALSAGLALQACGADPVPVGPAPAPTPVPTPPVQNIAANQDFMLTYIIPSLQQQYGNLTLEAAVTVGGTNETIAAGVYSWVDLYTRLTAMTAACNCYMANSRLPQGMSPGFANLNYNGFYEFIGGVNGAGFNTWFNVGVVTESGHRTSFYHIFYLLVSTAYSYYSQYYYSYVYNYGGTWPSYNYWPQPVFNMGNQVGGFLSYNNGSGFSLNVGGIFNF